jgi:hypothetical protein
MCDKAGLCQKGRVALAPIMELIKLRRFMMSGLLKQVVSIGAWFELPQLAAV